MSQKIKCLIVDDEPLATNIIKGYIDQVPQLDLIGTCSDAMEAFKVINQQEVDLLFLDIEMPELNGIDFLKSLANPPSVILTTAYREYAIESYEVEVIDYLLKPISFIRFFKSINKYLKQQNIGNGAVSIDAPPEKTTSGGSIYVYADKKNVKVYFDDILYVESIKDYVRIVTNSKNIISKSTISAYEELLPSSFLRIHRSFIVSSDKVTAFTKHDVEIGEKEIPIGVSYKQEVFEKLKKEG